MASRLRRIFNNLHWFVDQTEFKRETTNRRQGRRLVLEAIEAGDNNYLIVFVTSLGWFTDAFTLFCCNSITPALAYTYWNKEHEGTYDLSLNLATLGGCVFGQLLFGWLSDREGRRKVYGWELLVLMAGTTGVMMSSPGYSLSQASGVKPEDISWTNYGSMNVLAWLIWWRFVTGVGIGKFQPSLSIRV